MTFALDRVLLKEDSQTDWQKGARTRTSQIHTYGHTHAHYHIDRHQPITRSTDIIANQILSNAFISERSHPSPTAEDESERIKNNINRASRWGEAA